MDRYLHKNGYINNITDTHMHHGRMSARLRPKIGKRLYDILLKRLNEIMHKIVTRDISAIKT